MVTSFDNLLVMVNRYCFDIITMSETWLKENDLLLQHISIPGYLQAFNNRNIIRGGGVGIYLKESINFKRRSDLEKKYTGIWSICGLKLMAAINTAINTTTVSIQIGKDYAL